MFDGVLVIVGLGLLFAGGEALVRGAVGVAKRLGLSPALIGVTLVGFGTSTPELVTSVSASLAGSSGIAMGNVVGSNIANILLILGVSAVIAPIVFDRAVLRRDGAALVLATLVCIGVIVIGGVGRVVGFVFVIALVAYISMAVIAERAAANGAGEQAAGHVSPPRGLAKCSFFSLLGIGLVVVGAHALVTGGSGIAATFGVPEAVIGLTIVAVGTSLPELATSFVAARRGESGIALGNVLGSNVFNVLAVLGITGLIAPLSTPPQIAGFDVWVMAAATAALVGLALTRPGLSRPAGVVFLIAYAAYIGWLAVLSGVI